MHLSIFLFNCQSLISGLTFNFPTLTNPMRADDKNKHANFSVYSMHHTQTPTSTCTCSKPKNNKVMTMQITSMNNYVRQLECRWWQKFHLIVHNLQRQLIHLAKKFDSFDSLGYSYLLFYTNKPLHSCTASKKQIQDTYLYKSMHLLLIFTVAK